MNDTAPQHRLEPGRNCFRIEMAERASVIVDADDYFSFARAAMLKARRRITLIGWDFDGRIKLGRGDGDEAPENLGEFILWLVNNRPELEIFLLRWDFGALTALPRGTTFITLLRWMKHPRIHTKLDGAHPTASSHHQKIVVIDECLAFCGGIDMTADRWDTREHAFEDERRRRPTTGILYKPWHDATTAITGPMVQAIAQVCRERWKAAGAKQPMPPLTGLDDCWPDGLWTHFRNVPMAVSRSAPEFSVREPVYEIEQLWVDQIARAKNFIYAESQYFASRRIAEAIARRLEEPNGPEVIVINPVTAQGWLEPVAMDTARARLFETLRRLDLHQRFRIYHPYNAGGEAIYVHAKVLVVDDRILKVGSSNINNRSLRLDTECDVTIDADLGGDCTEMIAAIRNDLLADHLDTDPATIGDMIARTGSLIRTIETLRGEGRSLRPYETPQLSAVETWLADNEVLDPEGPSEMFEVSAKRGLLRRLKHRVRHRRPAVLRRRRH